jgi:DNA-binding MarR family transcriptional regulator
MKYFIGINQKVWLDKYPKVDLETALIFDIIKNFCAVRNNKIKKFILDNEEYTWINYQMIIDELPMLKFKSKGSISPRVNLLKKIGLIRTFRAPEGSIYVRLTEKASELIFDIPVHKNEQAVHIDEQPPVHLNEQHNHTTNINHTTISNTNILAVATATAEEINKIITFFKEVSPFSYKDYYKNLTERKSSAELLSRLPMEKLEILITRFLPKINVMPYVSKNCKAFKPSELLKNLDKIIVKIKELQQKRSEEKINIII